MNFIFFGTDSFSVGVLDELKTAGLMPQIIVTAPDRPAGRGNKMKKPEVKIWAEENNVKILQPEKLDSDFVKQIEGEWDMFALASFGKIIPNSVLEIPKKGMLNVHPSLLPKYRGASPIESAMLADDKNTGVTIMLVDSDMDHGPILLQEVVEIKEWPTKIELETQLAKTGGQLLAQSMIMYQNDEIVPIEQDHEKATFTKKISKTDGLITPDFVLDAEELDTDSAREIFLKIQALNPWPGVYFFFKKQGEDLRVKITEAEWINDNIKIKKVLPAGKNEMSWENFKNGFLNK
jgi:methionyl-tRNA formyltransferase